MVSLSEEKQIYAQIQKKLFYIIPEKWESVYLYASMIDMPNQRPMGEMYFYYFPKGIIKKKPVNCYEIPNAFNIDEEEYAKLIADLYAILKKLRQIWRSKHHKEWTNLTISIENFQFKVEYDYEDLTQSQFNSYERHVIWRYLYLKPNLRLLGRKDRNIIRRYQEFETQNELPKTDTYLEGMYSEPVRNIVDFEKTLSVEEALAQSEREDTPTETLKSRIFRKKRVLQDIIEIEEDGELTNNQILNWKKK